MKNEHKPIIKHNAKTISNLLKIIIVGFIFFNYMYQSKMAGHPLTADEGKCLLYIAICGFLILCPIDASIFIANFNKLKNGSNEQSENIKYINNEFENSD